MTCKVFTDYACPFCYIAYKMCKKVAAETGCVFTPVFMEIHRDMPAQGADAKYLFSENRRSRMNSLLREMGAPYAIAPEIGPHLSNSKKAIIIRAYLRENYPEKTAAYDEAVFALYQIEMKDIGGESLLEDVLARLPVREPLQEILADPAANELYRKDRWEADLHMVRKTPAFLIGKTLYQGLLKEEELKVLITSNDLLVKNRNPGGFLKENRTV